MIKYLTLENDVGKRFTVAYSTLSFSSTGVPINDNYPNDLDFDFNSASDLYNRYPAAYEFTGVTYYGVGFNGNLLNKFREKGFTDIRAFEDDFPNLGLHTYKVLQNGIWKEIKVRVEYSTMRLKNANGTSLVDNLNTSVGFIVGQNIDWEYTAPATSQVVMPLNVYLENGSPISPPTLMMYSAPIGGGAFFRFANYHYTDPLNVYNALYAGLSDSPYQGTPDSGEDGGGGLYDSESDPIPLPELPPTLNGTNSFTTLWIPTTEQLNAIGKWFWTDNILEVIKKLFADIVSAVLSLHVVPLSINNFNTAIFSVAGATSNIPTRYVTNQFYELDCGSLTIDKYYGSALDNSPHTSYLLYLPFIGAVSIDTDEIVGKTINVRYRIDIVTGGIVCYVLINNNVFYTYTSGCSLSIPISSANYGDMMLRLLGNAADSAAIIAKNGLSAPVAIGAGVQLAMNVMNAKPTIAHSGTVSEAYGWLGVPTPYLTIKRPRLSLPKDYQTFNGFPSNITAKLGDLKGYTVVEQIHIENTNLLEEEITMIEASLKGGVIL